MKEVDWQLWTALGIVCAAVFILLRRLRSFLTARGQSGCGGCPEKSRPDDTSPGSVIEEHQIRLDYSEDSD